jgi:hypothetical protein
VDGKLKQSGREADEGNKLIAAYWAGTIQNLRPDPDKPGDPQVRYPLYVFSTPEVEALLEYLETEARPRVAYLAELAQNIRRSKQKITAYRADYVYEDEQGEHVCDVKPKPRKRGRYLTETFRIKRDLFRAATGKEIEIL